MRRDCYPTLRKLVRKNQYRDFDGEIESFNQLIVLRNPERIIWTNGRFLAIDDPTLINSIGGKYVVRECLKKEPMAYDLQVKNNSLQIAGETSMKYVCQLKNIFLKPRSDLYLATIQEFENLRHNLHATSISKDFREYASYVQKTFSDKKIETFANKENGLYFYFFDNENIKAVLV